MTLSTPHRGDASSYEITRPLEGDDHEAERALLTKFADFRGNSEGSQRRRCADGMIVRPLGSESFRATYRITSDRGWRFRRVELQVGTDCDRILTLITDGSGHRYDVDGNELIRLRGCFEIEISATPFTNTLAIGRLQLAVGQSADLLAACIGLPELTVEVVAKRYTCVERSETQSAFKYEGLFRNFTAVISVDKNLLVMDYPETFRRVCTLPKTRPHEPQ